MNCYEYLSNSASAIISKHATYEVREQAPSDRRENCKPELERRLDQGLEETFPASDPVSVLISL
jgi:hypothetical protein